MAASLPCLEERCSTNKIKLKSVIFQTPSPGAKAHSRTCRQPVPGCSCLFLGATESKPQLSLGSQGKIWWMDSGTVCGIQCQWLWFAPGLSEKKVNQAVKNQNKSSWNVVVPRLV